LITGGTQGVGGAIAKTLASAGCNLILQGLRENQEAQETIAACLAYGVVVQASYIDLLQPISKTIEELKRCEKAAAVRADLLVNNVGVFIDKPFLEMEESVFDHTFHLNVKVGYFLTQAWARQWIADGIAGRVLFTGSINGLLAEPMHTAYDASKAAVAGLVRSLCVSLAPHNIRVNSMAPGLVRTPLTDQVLSADEKALEWMKLHTPNRQVPSADVCGGTAAFLLSDLASHIHGQTIYVDGGMSSWQQPDYPC
jgi:NAD(P)-dependent dehydrogenase (short-subunit alcohol dehydrogenase family)